MTDVCDVPVISTVCNKAGDAAASLVTAPFDWLAQGMANVAAWMFESVWTVFDTTTMVDVSSTQYTGVYNILFGVAVFVMLAFFMLQVIGGMIRREPAALSRAVLGLAKSILGSFVAITLVAVALEITDQLAIGIVHAAGTNMNEMGTRIGLLAGGLGTIGLAAPGAAAILTIFLAGLAIGAAVIVWISLLVRKALLLIAIVFAPIAMAGASWDQTRGWIGKWATFVIALIISKLVLVVMFLLATAQISAPIDADLQSVSDPIAGVVLMLMAGFAPYMSYKAINFMGFDMYHAMSAEQEAKSALNRPIPLPSGGKLGGSVPKVLNSTGTSGTGTGSGSSAAPVPASSGGASTAGSTGGAGATAGAGAVAGGLIVAKKAADAGPQLGNAVGAHASQHADAAQAPPAPASGAPTRAASPPPPNTAPSSGEK